MPSRNLSRSRQIMRIELSPTAKKQLADTCKKRGMTQVAVASRLVEWFTRQPETIQAAVLGQYPKEIEPDVVRLILERVGKGK